MDTLKREFKFRHFTLWYNNDRAFSKSQWPIPDLVYVIYRVLIASYALGWLIAEFTKAPAWASGRSDGKLLIYLTIWIYMLLNAHLTVAAVMTTYCYIETRCCRNSSNSRTTDFNQNSSIPTITSYHINRDLPNGTRNSADDVSVQTGDSMMELVDANEHSNNNERDHLRWFHKLSWLLFSISSNLSIAVTILYYGALWPVMSSVLVNIQLNPIDVAIDTNVHGVNSVLVLIDLFTSKTPVRLLHCIYPFCCGACYVIFSAIYWSISPETNVIYPVLLDWNNPELPCLLVFLLLFIGVPLMNSVLFGMYRLRVFLNSLCCRTSNARNNRNEMV